jgi:hypothetical protein
MLTLLLVLLAVGLYCRMNIAQSKPKNPSPTTPANASDTDADSTEEGRESPTKGTKGKNSGHAVENLRESPTLPSRPKGSAAASDQLVCRSKSAMDDWSTCSAAQVRDLNSGIMSGKRQHGILKLVDSVSLSSDGSLDCKQTSGEACTADQAQAVIDLASQTGGSVVVVRKIDMASPTLVTMPVGSSTEKVRGTSGSDTVGKSPPAASNDLRESPTLPSRPKDSTAVIHRDLACRSADGQSACSAAQVRDLNSGMSSGKRQHKPLMMVDSVSLSSDGMLTCKQTDGTACTDEQLQAVQQFAGELSKEIVLTSSYGSHMPTATLQK